MKKFAIHTAVQRLLAVGVAACLGALAQAGSLVYHSTLDSAESIISPAVGSAGTCTNAVFEQGYSGKALYLPASTSPVCIPFPNGLPPEKGCIEFWAKLNNKSQYVTTGGNPRFFCFNRTGTVNSSVAFLDINSTNGANGSGFTVVCGNITLPSIPESSYSYTRSFSYQSIMHGLDPQSWHRYVLRWNVNGLAEDSSSMLMLKLDDVVISTFPIASCNREEFMRMMKDSCELYFPLQDGFSDYSRVPYWIDEFKVWDSDRLGEAEPVLDDGVDVVNGVTWYYMLSQGKATIVKGTILYAGDLTTPKTLDGHPVVAIAESAFADCSELSSVVVSDGVVTVGNGAFARSRNVTRVSLPDSVIDIDQGCFYECEKLVDLRLPETLPIFNRFLMKGTAITSLVIPNGAKSIGDCAFYVAEKLESVTLPSTLTFIDWGAFHSATSLKSIEFPAGFQGFGNLNYSTTELYAVFGNCTSLEKAIFHGYLPYGLEYTWLTHLNCKIYYPREFASEWSAVIPAAKFGGYTEDLGGEEPSVDPVLNDGVDVVDGVTWYYTLTDGKATIVKGAIPYAGDLTTPKTLDGYPVVAIGEKAFSECQGLTSIVVSDGVVTIGSNAFERCPNLLRASLPDSATNFVASCFYECEKLAEVRFPTSLRVFCPHFLKGTSVTSVVVPNDVEEIGFCAFYLAEKMASVTLPPTVTFIDWGAFHSATSLKTIEFPAALQGFGNWNHDTTELHAVFGNCTSLEKAIFHGHLPYGLEYTWLTHLNCKIYYPREFASEWSAVIPAAKFGGYTEDLGGGNEPDPGPGGGEEPVVPTAGELVYYTTFDSAAEFETPAVGPSGTVFNATFQEGKQGNALYVPAGQNAARVTFANGLPVEKGCIEFWAKIEGDAACFGDGGNPCFYLFIPAGCAWKDTIESLELTGNNGLGKAGWHLVHTGCMWETTGSAFTVGNDEYQTVFGELAPKAWHHYQIRWNVNGLNGNSENVMLFTVDGVPMLATAKANFVRSTADYDGRLGIPLDLSFSEPLNPGRCNRVPFLIDEFKVWNSDVIGNGDPDPQPGENADDGVDVIDGVTWYYTLADGKATIVKGEIPYAGDLTTPKTLDGHPVVAIAEGAFINCNGLTSVVVSDGVETIGSGGFARCPNLVKAVLPDSATNIVESCFYECFKLTEFRLPSSLPFMGAFFFKGTPVTNVVIPEGVVYFGHDVFYDATKLESVTLPSTLKFLDWSAFQNSCSLKSVEFPAGFEGFGTLHDQLVERYAAFGQCTSLATAIFHGHLPYNFEYSWLTRLNCKIYYPREFASEWSEVIPAAKFGGYTEDLGGGNEPDPGPGGNEPDPGPGGNEPDPGPGGGEEPVQPTAGELVYYTTFDSAAEFETPAVGPTGSVFNATFQEGKKGNALYVPAGQNAARVTFANGLPVEKGCIEFWAKIEGTSAYFGDGGNPCFYLFIPAGCAWKDTIESLELTGNNGLGKSGWHLVHTGGMWETSGSVGSYCTYGSVFGDLAPTAWHHYQIRWNVSGLNGNSENVMLFTVDGVPMLATAKANFVRSTADYDGRLGIPLDLSFSEPLNPGRCNRVPFLIDEFKVWNSDVVGTTPEPTPTVDPVIEPTVDPVVEPTVDPVVEPTVDPVVEPTVDPTVDPVVEPTVDPTVDPVVEPTVDPTVEPVVVEPTVDPVVEPTVDPVVVEPTVDPVVEPTVEPEPSDEVKPLEFPVLEDGATVQVECRQGVAVEMPVVFGTLANPDARASGLPSGLKFKDGVIVGVAKTATRANKPKSAKFTVKLPTGKKVKLVAEFTVLPRADWCVGTFDGAVLADGACVGTATFKLAANGKGTGSFTMIANGRKQKLALKCVSLKSYSAEREETKLALTTKDGSVLNFVLTANEDGVGRMETESGNPGCVMLQNVWKAKRVDAPAFLTGRNACTLTLDNGLTLKLQSKGVVKISGKVEGANGKLVKVNAKSQLLPEGFGDGESNASVVVFVPPKRALPNGIVELLPLRLEKNGAGVITRAVLVVVR